ncbi:MAG: methyltransferase domain-containing protein [Candidatus Lokiarchaeota archaeon]|nr:methyltransferase domain-containing protein [Candidatus Lokiarchaeota archaeon]
MPDLYNLGMRLTFIRKFRHFPEQWKDNFNWGDLTLEIGCGTGEWSRIPKEKHKVVIGLEISEKFLDTHISNRKKGIKHHFCDHLVCASADYLPFRNNSIDVGYSCDVIHHIPLKSQSKFFKESKRVLKKYYMPLEMKLYGFPLIFATVADELQKRIWGYDYNYNRLIFLNSFKLKKHRQTFMYDWFIADCKE